MVRSADALTHHEAALREEEMSEATFGPADPAQG